MLTLLQDFINRRGRFTPKHVHDWQEVKAFTQHYKDGDPQHCASGYECADPTCRARKLERTKYFKEDFANIIHPLVWQDALDWKNEAPQAARPNNVPYIKRVK